MKIITILMSSLLLLCALMSASASTITDLQLTTVRPLAQSIVKGKNDDMMYRLSNHSQHTHQYFITVANNQQWQTEILTSDSQSCDVQGHQTILMPNAECTIHLRITAHENITQLDINDVLSMSADIGIHSTDTAKFHNMIVFGDSLSDIKGKATNNDPNGKKLWDEVLYDSLDNQLAQRNGIYSYPASKQTTDCDNANHCNIVYAVGGNTTKNLATQVDQYKKQLQGQPANAGTIVFIWLGGNDFKAFAEMKDDPVKAVERIKAGVQILKEELHVKADHIYLMNLPNINKMPLLAGESLEDKIKRAAAATTTALYNGLMKNLADTEHVKLINIQSNDTNIHNHLAEYGFDVIATEKQQSCSAHATNKQTCQSAAGYFMYWDTVHPTVYTHSLIAKYVLSQLS